MKKYLILTYGCQMNKSDSERIASGLERKGYGPAQKMEQADLILVNMCSVRQSAVDRIHGLILKFKKLKAKNRKLKTILTGCVLKSDKKKFRNVFDSIWEDKKHLDFPPKRQKGPLAFVPISNGCNNSCTYCAVPHTRGPLKCLSCSDILKEIKDAVKKGFKEIWLLGQNVNDYRSPTDNSVNFAKLLEKIDEIPGSFKLLFTSPHPKNFSDELIDALSSCKKFGRYLNLPLQSGDDKILRKMRRNYSLKEYMAIVKKLRKKMPGIKLSTDIIVGFPGETKKQFQNTAKAFKEIKFNNAYISKYSPRSGTTAFQSKDNVPMIEKKKREKILRRLINN